MPRRDMPRRDMPRRDSVSTIASQNSTGDASVFSYTSSASTATAMSLHHVGPGQGVPRTLPCEFVGYHMCDSVFRLNDFDSWIQHIITDHLQNRLPETVACWFCDDQIFSCTEGDDPYTNFELRMWHIYTHISYEGCAVQDMRPDHFLNDHLKNNKLISDTAYNGVREYTECSSQTAGLIPYNTMPAQREARGLWDEPDNYCIAGRDHRERRRRNKK